LYVLAWRSPSMIMQPAYEIHNTDFVMQTWETLNWNGQFANTMNCYWRTSFKLFIWYSLYGIISFYLKKIREWVWLWGQGDLVLHSCIKDKTYTSANKTALHGNSLTDKKKIIPGLMSKAFLVWKPV
jgi:hypothetical protein